jgi:hypothetical protein
MGYAMSRDARGLPRGECADFVKANTTDDATTDAPPSPAAELPFHSVEWRWPGGGLGHGQNLETDPGSDIARVWLRAKGTVIEALGHPEVAG